MRKFLLPYPLLVLLFVLPAYAFSQTKSQLSGTVSDSSSKALDLVTVRLFKKNNAAPLQVALSKDNGRFQLNKPDTGNYILSFTHTGFDEKRITIIVDSHAGDMHIDPVQLSRASGVLKEVVVTKLFLMPKTTPRQRQKPPLTFCAGLRSSPSTVRTTSK